MAHGEPTAGDPAGGLAGGLTIRRANPSDSGAIGDVWLDSWRATFDFPPAHHDADVRRWIAEELVVREEVWIAVEATGRIIGMLALSATMLEQLYVAPEWIGRGVGSALLALARTRRPDGLDLWCFQANRRARHFYQRNGFRAVFFGGGSDNMEGQPDIRYAWRPEGASQRWPAAPDALPWQIASRDGTLIAAFRSGTPTGPPLILVHGTSADHTTFRVIGPLLESTFDVIAIDRRGRGASGDTLPYSIEREFEDVTSVAEAIAAVHGVPAVAAFGHSYGGRCALGAARISDAIARVVCYEGAPAAPGERYGDAGLAEDLAALAAADENERLLETFMERVVGMSRSELDAYRADPIWPRRVAAAPTIARELLSESTTMAGLEALGGLRKPVLQILGGDSAPAFVTATMALAERLVDGRVVTIPGARHGAHHTHPDAVAAAVTSFLLERV